MECVSYAQLGGRIHGSLSSEPLTIIAGAEVRIRATVVAVCTAIGLIVGSAGPAFAVPAPPPQPLTEELDGICGTLLGAGTGVASLGKTVVARGAGWVSAIIAAGCLVKDAIEYTDAFNASPEGVARIRELQARYRGYTLDRWMTEFGCVFRENPPVHTDSAVAEGGSWDCSRSPYATTD